MLPSGYKQTSPSGGLGIHLTVTSTSSFTGENFTDTAPASTPPPPPPPPPPPTPKVLTGTLIGTAGSYKSDGNTAAKAFDGNLSTYFDGPTGSGDWVGLDLGSAATIASISFAARSGYSSRMNGGIFQASNTADFSSGVVTLYALGSSANPPAGKLTTINVNATGSYRYLRYLAPANSYGDVAEIQFVGTLSA